MLLAVLTRLRNRHILVLPYMASLVAKQKGHQLYYYVVESARVHGKPRIVHQAYLGTADKVAALVKDRTSPIPLSAASRDFGCRALCGSPRSKPDSGVYGRRSGPHLDRALRRFWDAFEKILPEHLDPLATGDDDPLDRAQLRWLDLWKGKESRW